VRAYARAVADLFEWVSLQGRNWRALEIEDIAEWVAWLRLPELARTGGIAVLPTVEPSMSVRTLWRKLVAINAFFVFHAWKNEGEADADAS
jgi:site-specific recombinase XerD